MRGRPAKSQIRANIIEILNQMNEGYGYEISKVYNKVYPKVSMRSIYYHLKKGVDLEEIKIHKIDIEKGDFSWGKEVEKIFYSLGPNAEPHGDDRLKNLLGK